MCARVLRDGPREGLSVNLWVRADCLQLVKADRRSSTECPLEFRIGLFGNTFLFLTIALSLRAAAGCLKYHFN